MEVNMRKYTIGDQEYPSVTTVLGMLDKGEYLMQWAIDLCLEKNNRLAWKEKRDKTADIGSELHSLIETFINMKLLNKLSELRQFDNYISNQPNQLKQMFYQFYNWQKKNVKIFIASEQTVFNKSFCIAGTLDFIYEGYDNFIHCSDLKTTSFKPYRMDNGKMNYNLKKTYKNQDVQACVYAALRESLEGKHKIQLMYNEKYITYQKIKIDVIEILTIERDFFNLSVKDVTKYKNQYIKAFVGLLDCYYSLAKRKLNNWRCK
jgi:hypothetical protein